MTNTIPNVPRDCGHDACKSLGEPHPFCKFVSALDAAPSPAGVDGLEVVAQVVIDLNGSNKRVIFHSTKALHGLPVWTKLSVTADAQAIIDGLRGEAAQFKATISDSESVFVNMMRGTIAKPSLRSMVKLYSGEVLNGEDALQLELAKAMAIIDELKEGAHKDGLLRVRYAAKIERQAQRITELGLLLQTAEHVLSEANFVSTGEVVETTQADRDEVREKIIATLTTGSEVEA